MGYMYTVHELLPMRASLVHKYNSLYIPLSRKKYLLGERKVSRVVLENLI